MVNIRLKILDKGKIINEQLIQILQKHEDAIANNSSSDTAVASDVSDLKTAVGDSKGGLVKDVADINTAIGDADTEGSIIARIKALEDAQEGGNDTPPSG